LTHEAFTVSRDGTIRIWDLSQFYEAPAPALRFDVASVEISDDGHIVAFAGLSSSAAMWDVSSGKSWLLQSLSDTKALTITGRFSVGSRFVATTQSDGVAVVRTVPDGRLVCQTATTKSPAGSADFNPNNTKLVVAYNNGDVLAWEIPLGSGAKPGTGECLHPLRIVHKNIAIDRVRFDPSGKYLAIASDDGTIELWDGSLKQINKPLKTFPRYDGWVMNLEFEPGHKLLATSHQDGKVRIWRVNGDDPLLVRTLIGHTDVVSDAKFSPDGTYVATASYDHTVKIWDVEQGQELVSIAEFPDRMRSLVFSKDGKRLIVGGYGGVVRQYVVDLAELIRMARLRITRPLNDEECQEYLHRRSCP
jgi:WD40 repeat protein